MTEAAARRYGPRRIALGLAAVLVATPLAACGGSSGGGGGGTGSSGAGAGATKVTTTVGPSVATAPLQIAVAKGFFAANNISINVAPTTPPSQTIQLLIGGKLDIALASPGAALNNAVAGGAPIVMLGSAASVPSDTAKPNAGLLVSEKAWNSGIKSIADLKGKTINITPSLQSASGLAVAKLLEKGGLKLSDVRTQDWTQQPQLVQAFDNGAAPVSWVLEPALSSEQKNHGAHMLGSAADVIPNSPALSILANKKWVDAHPDATVDFLRAYLQGVQYVNEGLSSNWAQNADALNVIAKSTGMSVDSLKGIAFSQFPADGKVNPSDIAELISFVKDLGSIKKVVDPSTYIDLSYIEKAAAK